MGGSLCYLEKTDTRRQNQSKLRLRWVNDVISIRFDPEFWGGSYLPEYADRERWGRLILLFETQHLLVVQEVDQRGLETHVVGHTPDYPATVH